MPNLDPIANRKTPGPSPSSLISSFGRTNLDVEDPKILGGPNRTNSSNIPTGQYLNIGAHNITDENGEVTLKDKAGNDVYTQLHNYTPNNTYLDSNDWENKFPTHVSPNPLNVNNFLNSLKDSLPTKEDAGL